MKVTSIAMENGKARIVVEMRDPERFLTTDMPHVPSKLLELLPGMRMHKCDNYDDLTFDRECMQTEVGHLFEHLVNELQLQMYDDGSFKGETCWDWTLDPKGVFHILTEYRDEVVLVAAVRTAESMISRIDLGRYDASDLLFDMRLLRSVKDIAEQFEELQFEEKSVDDLAA